VPSRPASSACRTEADHTGPKRPAIFTGDSHELHGVQYRDAPPQAGIDLLQMQRVDRKPPLVLLLRPRQHPETEHIHARSPGRVLVRHPSMPRRRQP
jgi:hypothetical protein